MEVLECRCCDGVSASNIACIHEVHDGTHHSGRYITCDGCKENLIKVCELWCIAISEFETFIRAFESSPVHWL